MSNHVQIITDEIRETKEGSATKERWRRSTKLNAYPEKLMPDPSLRELRKKEADKPLYLIRYE